MVVLKKVQDSKYFFNKSVGFHTFTDGLKMADVAAARSSGVPEFVSARLKPDVYTTIDDQVIAEDEFLHFLSIKLKTLSQDEIVLLAVNTFESDWIETSKKTLFELCSTTQRNISHKGAQKDVNNVKACLKVLNECGDNVPRFVSHYLDELPSVTFTSMDVCGLLRKMEQLHAVVFAMKHSLQIQTETSEALHAVTVDVSGRVRALELRADHGCADQSAPSKELGAAKEDVSTPVEEFRALDAGHNLQGTERGSLSGMEGDTPALCTNGTTPLPGSPKWSQVVERGQRKNRERVAAKPAPHPGSTVGRRKAGKTIVGTGAAGNIKTVKTKLVGIPHDGNDMYDCHVLPAGHPHRAGLEHVSHVCLQI